MSVTVWARGETQDSRWHDGSKPSGGTEREVLSFFDLIVCIRELSGFRTFLRFTLAKEEEEEEEEAKEEDGKRSEK